MNQIAGTKDPEGEPVAQSLPQPQELVPKGSDKSESITVSGEEQEVVAEEKAPMAMDYPIEEESVGPATVFCIKLKQPKSNLLHKMSVPELCRNFRYVQFGATQFNGS